MGRRRRRGAKRKQSQEHDAVTATADTEPHSPAGLLLAQIAAAFDAVPPPGQSHRSLYQAEAWDDYKVVDQSRDHSGRWQDLPPQQLLDCPYALPHLDAYGVRYYLPALMTLFIAQPATQRLILFDSLLSMLGPAGHGLSAYRKQRLALLTDAQRGAVSAFVRFVKAPAEVQTCWPAAAGQKSE